MMNRYTVIASTTQRVFWICTFCGRKEAIDYIADTLEQSWQGRKVSHVKYYRMVEETYVTPNDDRGRVCSGCGTKCYFHEKWLKYTVLKPGHRCDARCQMAVSVKCECECGGANHGIAHKRCY